MKRCACGRAKKRPKGAKYFHSKKTGGWYWDCICGSTKYQPTPLIEIKLFFAKLYRGETDE